jgi:hypothetical protein
MIDTISSITPSRAYNSYNCLPKSSSPQTSRIVDSGTTGHYLMTTSLCTNLKEATKPIIVNIPDGSTIKSTHTCTIDLPGLPEAARHAPIFPALADHSLLSVGQICDADCQVEFTATHVNINRDDKCFLQGHRALNGLWSLDLQPTPQHTANAATITNSSSITEQLQHLHACCFSPSKSTWLEEIQCGHFITWPGLNVDAVTKHFQPPIATTLGHLDQKRKNLQSTKPPSSTDDDCNKPDPIQDGKRTHCIYAAMEELPTHTGAISTDQT